MKKGDFREVAYRLAGEMYFTFSWTLPHASLPNGEGKRGLSFVLFVWTAHIYCFPTSQASGSKLYQHNWQKKWRQPCDRDPVFSVLFSSLEICCIHQGRKRPLDGAQNQLKQSGIVLKVCVNHLTLSLQVSDPLG